MPRVAAVMDDDAAVGDESPMSGTTVLALGVGAVSVLVALAALNPVLVNTYGPFGGHATLGLLASLAVALLLGAAVALVTRAVAERSTLGVVVLTGVLAGLVVVAFPTPVDRHESFVERPNERSSCRGVVFRHYPPDTSDGSSQVYCVGLESPLPDG